MVDHEQHIKMCKILLFGGDSKLDPSWILPTTSHALLAFKPCHKTLKGKLSFAKLVASENFPFNRTCVHKLHKRLQNNNNVTMI